MYLDFSFILAFCEMISASRQEVTSVRTPWTGLCESTRSLFPANFAYRQQLLQISEELSEQHVKRLCYLCKDVLPKMQCEQITEGFQLFDLLEDQRLLASDNLTFLSECLSIIGKMKLAASLPYTPQSFVTQQLVSVFHSKANHYASTMENLGKADLFPRIHLTQLLAEVYFVLKMDLPTNLGIPPELSMADLDRIVATTLREIFLCSAAQRKLACTLVSNDFQARQVYSAECHTYYTHFDNAVTEIKWNSVVCAKVRNVISERREPQGTGARKACEYIRQVCVDILRSDQIQQHLDEASKHLFALESIYYNVWQKLPMYHWLVNLLYLAKSSILDLSKHCELLLMLLEEHRKGIIENYSELSQILGQEVLDDLAPLLRFSKNDYIPKCNPSIAYTMTWHVFLLQLVYLAMGYSIEPKEVGERYTKLFFYGDNHNKLFENGMLLLAAAVGYNMHVLMVSLKHKALELANSTPYNVPIVELFPDGSHGLGMRLDGYQPTTL